MLWWPLKDDVPPEVLVRVWIRFGPPFSPPTGARLYPGEEPPKDLIEYFDEPPEAILYRKRGRRRYTWARYKFDPSPAMTRWEWIKSCWHCGKIPPRTLRLPYGRTPPRHFTHAHTLTYTSPISRREAAYFDHDGTFWRWLKSKMRRSTAR